MGLSQKQLETRRKGVSASDVASIVGENPWRTPIDVWCEKVSTEPPVPKPETEQQALGHVFEKFIASHYAKDLAPAGFVRRVFEPKVTLQHPTIPWAFATPDRFVFEAPIGTAFPRALKEPAVTGKASHLLEVKLVGPRAVAHWIADTDDEQDEDDEQDDSERVPIYVLIQCQWQMLVTGYRRVDICALLGGTRLRVFRIDYDEAFVADLTRVCEEFWVDHVMTGQEPPPDGTKGYRNYLGHKFGYATIASLAKAPAQAEIAARNYATIGVALKDLNKKRETESQILKSLIGPYDGIEGEWGKATWKPSPGRVDYRALVEDLKVSAAKFDKHRKPGRTFRVTIRKEK